MVVTGRWLSLYFKTPSRFLENGVRPIAPDITVDDRGRVMFNWFAEIPVERAEFSDRYVVGVDVGRNSAAFSVVVDVTTGDVVEASGGNRRIRTLENRISRTENQIRSLHRAGRHDEAALHREGLANRRNELSVLVGQEVADLSFRYDNALVAVEDLSGIRNTMSHGRWVRGQMVQRATDMVEADGGRVMKVNPAYTSQKCHVCSTQMDMRDSRRPRCLVCKVTWDRDENAAVNIAKRAPHGKACATRRKSASTRRRRNSKGSVTPLRHPLSKGRSTPKAPQNRPQDNHMLEHSKRFRHEKQKGGATTRTTCAVGWSPAMKTGVSVPTVGSSCEDVQTTSRTTTPCSATGRDTTSRGDTKV
jgi:IS605 family transposase